MGDNSLDPPSITYPKQLEMEQFDSLSLVMVNNHLPLATIPFCLATNLTLKYRTIRNHGDLITARAKSPASSNRAAELVPGEKKSSLPVNYAIILLFQTDRGGRSSSWPPGPREWSEEIPRSTVRGWIIPWLLPALTLTPPSAHPPDQ